MMMALARPPAALSSRDACAAAPRTVVRQWHAQAARIGASGTLMRRRSPATLLQVARRSHRRPPQCSGGAAEAAPPDEATESAGDPQAREVVDVMIASPSIEALTGMYIQGTTAQAPPSQRQRKLGDGRRRARGQAAGGGGGGLHWILGPLALLVTGAIPALWLPAPALFAGSATAGLLALTGLDATFNMGATAFLLMANYSAGSGGCRSQDHDEDEDEDVAREQQQQSGGIVTVPFGYKAWSFFVNLVGLAAPVALLLAAAASSSARGFLEFEPGLHALPAAALLGPYALLLLVQWLAEATLVWPWQSPVWPVVPLVYQAYRLLQLSRGLDLGAALQAPAWMVEAVKALVAWWVFVLAVQMMWVAWLVGTIQTRSRFSRGAGGSRSSSSSSSSSTGSSQYAGAAEPLHGY